MAEAPDLPKTLEEMEREITCAVCHEHYREPKILPCFHYFCAECLQQLAAHVGQPVPCPECRKATNFPMNDARQLRTAFFVNRMIDFYVRVKKALSKKEVLCEACSGGRAEAFCRQCTEFICSECIKQHGRMTIFTGHEIASMEQLRMSGARLIPEVDDPPKKCEKHAEVLKLFCYTCNQLICRDCTMYDHTEPEHKHTFVNEAVPQCREKLRECVAPLQQTQTKLKAAVANVQAAKREVAENHATASRTIQRSIDQMFAILQQRKQQLLAKASELAEEKLGALNAQEESLDVSIAESQSLIDFVERSLQNASGKELLEMKQQIANGVEESCKKQQRLVDLQPAAQANIGTDMSFDQQALRTVGCVGLDVINTTKCTIRAYRKVEIHKPAVLTLHLVDSTGQSYVGLPGIVVEVKSLVKGSVISATVTRVYDGIYRATYALHIRGRHSVTVRVNGREICGSPFLVFVQIPPVQLKQAMRSIDGLSSPIGIAISNREEVLVSEKDGGRVSVFDKQGRKLRTIQHNDLPQPVSVATDLNGNMYVCTKDDSVIKFSCDGQPLKVNKSLGCELRQMQVIGDTLFICSGHAVLLVDCNNLHFIREFGKQGDGNGTFRYPQQVLYENGKVCISDWGNCCIQVFHPEGLNFVDSFEVKDTSTQQLCNPRGICVGPDGLLYVACWNPSCVLVFTLRGEFVASLGGVGEKPAGVAIDADGFVYVSCFTSGTVLVY